MGRAWPQTIPNGKQPRRFQAKNPERSMVAACKPWDALGLKLLQKHAKSKTFHGSRPQTMGRAWPQTASKIRTSDKDLPVQVVRTIKKEVIFCQECGSMFT